MHTVEDASRIPASLDDERLRRLVAVLTPGGARRMASILTNCIAEPANEV